MENFHTTFTLNDNTHPQRRTVDTEDVISAVKRSVEEDPNQTMLYRAQELDVSIHFMEDIVKRSWFACLQNPTRA